jgi:hypothetical protein
MIKESNILSTLKDVRTLLAMRMSRKIDLDTNQSTGRYERYQNQQEKH